MVSEKTIGRLSLYRRLLAGLLAQNRRNIYSRELASMAGGTAPQVRRDLMAIGYSGSPAKGYDVADLAESISSFIDDPDGTCGVIVGAGNLGRAIMAHFETQRPKLRLAAAFDSDPRKIGSDVCGRETRRASGSCHRTGGQSPGNMRQARGRRGHRDTEFRPEKSPRSEKRLRRAG